MDPTALGDGRETGVGVAVVAHLVGEDGPQLSLGQARHQRQSDVEPPGAAREPEEAGVLADRRVDVAGEQDLVGGAGPDLPGDVPHGLPEPWLVAVVHPYAGHVLLGGVRSMNMPRTIGTASTALTMKTFSAKGPGVWTAAAQSTAARPASRTKPSR